MSVPSSSDRCWLPAAAACWFQSLESVVNWWLFKHGPESRRCFFTNKNWFFSWHWRDLDWMFMVILWGFTGFLCDFMGNLWNYWELIRFHRAFMWGWMGCFSWDLTTNHGKQCNCRNTTDHIVIIPFFRSILDLWGPFLLVRRNSFGKEFARMPVRCEPILRPLASQQ